MYLLLIVLQALCELVNSGVRAPQLEPVRRNPEEPEGSAGREQRRAEPSLCSAFDVAIPPGLTRTGKTPRWFRAPRCVAYSPGTGQRRRCRD